MAGFWRRFFFFFDKIRSWSNLLFERFNPKIPDCFQVVSQIIIAIIKGKEIITKYVIKRMSLCKNGVPISLSSGCEKIELNDLLTGSREKCDDK